jgi:hypothetical protein
MSCEGKTEPTLVPQDITIPSLLSHYYSIIITITDIITIGLLISGFLHLF